MPRVKTQTTFGPLLKQYRIEARLTQEALAERSGLGIRSIQHLERGECQPQRVTLHRLIAALPLSDEQRVHFAAAAQPGPRRQADVTDSVSQARTVPHNLPIQVTSFIGRRRHIAAVQYLLSETTSGPRLLTLTGAGGSGKTRLALEVAATLLEAFEDGVWLVELASLTDPILMPQTVAAVLGVHELPDRSLTESLLQFLRHKRILLVMDNCEHLIAVCAVLVERLLKGCQGLRILATSQASLGIAGEKVWRVPPLEVPAPSRSWHKDNNLVQLIAYEAIQLFIERATAVQPSFVVTKHNAEVLAEICYRLDGLPLAIELAAARVKVLSLEDIANRLQDRFRLLTNGSRTALPRQQMLQAMVDWSHSLLTPAEKALFRQLSVFSGSFTLDAIETICSDPLTQNQGLLDILSGLVDKSLVEVEIEHDGSVRYRLLETIRQYAHEKSCEGEENALLRNRHLYYFLAFAEQAYAGRIDSATLWLDQLEREHDNLRSALDWAQRCDRGAELELAGALGWFWNFHAHLSEGRTRLEYALKGREERSRAMARVLWGIGMIAAWQGDRTSARLADESLALWRELGDQVEVALALEALGWGKFLEGNDPGAKKDFEESLQIASALGNTRLLNHARLGICQVLVSEGDIAAVAPLAEEALSMALQHQDPRDIHFAYHFLADCALLREDMAEAEQLYIESLQAALQYGDTLEASFEIQGIAMALAGQSLASEALRLAGAVTVYRKRLHAVVLIPFWERLLAQYLGQAKAQLSPQAATLAWEEGQNMSFDQMVAYTLERRTPEG